MIRDRASPTRKLLISQIPRPPSILPLFITFFTTELLLIYHSQTSCLLHSQPLSNPFSHFPTPKFYQYDWRRQIRRQGQRFQERAIVSFHLTLARDVLRLQMSRRGRVLYFYTRLLGHISPRSILLTFDITAVPPRPVWHSPSVVSTVCSARATTLSVLVPALPSTWLLSSSTSQLRFSSWPATLLVTTRRPVSSPSSPARHPER